MKEWLSRKETCEVLGMSMATLNRTMKAGKITFYKNGLAKSSKTRFKRTDVMKYLQKTKNN